MDGHWGLHVLHTVDDLFPKLEEVVGIELNPFFKPVSRQTILLIWPYGI